MTRAMPWLFAFALIVVVVAAILIGDAVGSTSQVWIK